MPAARPPEERFWEKVVKTDGCWLWTAGKFSHGYGVFHARGKVLKAHRVSWELVNGPIPEGMCVCHTCDVRSCVNPDHLFLGTNADNMKDMADKGRGVYPRGEAHGMAKLTGDQVREIRRRYRRGSKDANLAELAAEFGVGSVTVHAIVTGKRWTHLGEAA